MELEKQTGDNFVISAEGPDSGTIIVDMENKCVVPSEDYMEHKQFYDDLAKEIAMTGQKRKRTASTIKHIFLVVPNDGYTLDDIDIDAILDKLLEFLWTTCRKQDNPPRFKLFGKKIISVEFLKARRVDYDSLDIDNVKLVKRPFKALYNSVDYLQLTLDKFLTKKNN